MSETIQELLKRLQAVPEPKNKKEKEDLGLLKIVGRIFVTMLTLQLTPEQWKEMMEKNTQSAIVLASRLGADNEAVIIIMQMISLMKKPN